MPFLIIGCLLQKSYVQFCLLQISTLGQINIYMLIIIIIIIIITIIIHFSINLKSGLVIQEAYTHHLLPTLLLPLLVACHAEVL
jgi:hypothetical protein